MQCLRLLRVRLVFADVDTRVGTVEATLVHERSEHRDWRGVQLSEELSGHIAHLGLGGGRAEMQTVPIKRTSNTFSYTKDFNGENMTSSFSFFISLQVFISKHINNFIPCP